MKHFSTFSQRPSPKAPAPRPQKMLQITLVSWDKVSSRLDQMAPRLCPFEISPKLKKKIFESTAQVLAQSCSPTAPSAPSVQTGQLCSWANGQTA